MIEKTEIQSQTCAAEKTAAPRRRRRLVLLCCIPAAVLLLMAALLLTALRPLRAEAGEPLPEGRDFCRFSFLPVQLESDLGDPSFGAQGKHTVLFSLLGLPLRTTLTVADTVPPVFHLQDVTVLGEAGALALRAENFITEASDASAFTAELDTASLQTVPGTHAIRILFTDAHGNRAEGTASLTVCGTADSLTVEAGTFYRDCIDRILEQIPHAEISREDLIPVLRTLGTFEIPITVDGLSFTFHLTVADTRAPDAVLSDAYTVLNLPVTPEDFVVFLNDGTEVQASFTAPPDLTRPGQQQVSLSLRDAAGNTASLTSTLFVYNIPSAITAEAGTSPDDLSQLLFGAEAERCSILDGDLETLTALGTHTATVLTPGGAFPVQITLEDTTSPTAETADVRVGLRDFTEPAPDDFLVSVRDASAVRASFAQTPDFSAPGTQTVYIRLTDEAGNTAEVSAALHIIDDRDAPRILGVRPITVYEGGSLSYRSGVTAQDAAGAALTVSVDSSAVRTTVPGVYPVRYTAVDKYGKSTTVQTTVTVEDITEDVLRPYAEKILSRITNDGMEKLEAARAVYDYMTANVSYTAYNDKTDWMRAAYVGFTTGRGDCYVYYAMSRILLDCAGIENMEIRRNNPSQPHYWNLVNCGDGWYHFDTCPHYKNYPLTCFMLTDAQVRAYSENKVKDYYSFDASLYPPTP